MKDVISVDDLLEIYWCSSLDISTSKDFRNKSGELDEEKYAKAKANTKLFLGDSLHRLLISKLPEKHNRKPDEEYMYCITCNQIIDSLEADCFCSIHNLAVDDMRKSIDELFGVQNA